MMFMIKSNTLSEQKLETRKKSVDEIKGKGKKNKTDVQWHNHWQSGELITDPQGYVCWFQKQRRFYSAYTARKHDYSNSIYCKQKTGVNRL